MTARRGRTSRRRICRRAAACSISTRRRAGRAAAYYAVYRYLLGDYQPYLYKTDDYGKTWTRLTDGKNGIPADWPTRVVREDPKREGCSTRAPSSVCSSRSTTAGTGSRSSSICRRCRSPTSRSTTAISSSRRRAARSGFSTTSVRSSNWCPTAAGQRCQRHAVHLFKPRDGYRTRVSPNLYGPMIDVLPAACRPVRSSSTFSTRRAPS